ncbi:sulfatase-like hydrolase/transferase [bacterium]|nr:sulfatase-like hydrolase/transferase [bacterium]MBU1071630.1 sulfatase-like hydrolase/transferase [bacterium]MBU1675068.1 sulfatase-like hydrolase/transferase [bacterium]
MRSPRFRFFVAPALVACLLASTGCGSGGDGGDPARQAIDAVVEVTSRQNIIIILLDAAGAKHFSFYGYDRETTPYLSALARESVVFENAYAQASGTMLSVFSYFTSRYPVFGDDVNITRETLLKIPPEMTTMAEVMARRYDHRLGFTCNTWLKSELGHGQGFTEFHHLWDLPTELLLAADERGPADVLMIAHTLEWMKERAQDGFFAYLHFMIPHSPYRPPEPFCSLFTRGPCDKRLGSVDFLNGLQGTRPAPEQAEDIEALYDASLTFIDYALGAMIRKMQAEGVWDDTIFILMSDHGEAFWEHGTHHGHGGIAYEEVVRVPLVVHIPGLPDLAGRRIAQPVELVDLLPTLMELQGIPRDTLQLAGRSLVPLLAGVQSADAGQPPRIFSQTNRRIPPIFAWYEGDLKLLWEEGGEDLELYDLGTDPGERVNLIGTGDHDDVAGRLWAELRSFLAQGGAHGAAAEILPVETLDEASRQRLRSLGYID